MGSFFKGIQNLNNLKCKPPKKPTPKFLRMQPKPKPLLRNSRNEKKKPPPRQLKRKKKTSKGRGKSTKETRKGIK
jgi:hypothetical protein